MKIKTLLPVFLALAFAGCSDDNDNTSAPPQNDNNYFPLTVNNSWTYANERQAQEEPATQSTETLMVVDSTESKGLIQYDLESNNTVDGGPATLLFANGQLSKVDGELLYNGSFEIEIGLPGMETLEIPINNAVVFSTTANAGTELFVYSDQMTQDVPVGETTVPVTVEYTVTSTNLGILESRTVAGQDFEDVLSSNLIVSVKATANLGPFSVTVMNEQEVVSATNYFANHVGMVESDVNIAYEFEDLREFGFPDIPPTDVQSTQEIKSYVVAE